MSYVGRKLTDFTCFDLTQNKLLEIEARGRLCVTRGEFDSVCVRARVCAHIHGYSVFADLLLVSEELTVML